MGWFDEQIRQRKKDDADILSEALYDISSAVYGGKTFFSSGNAKNETDKILEYYGVKSRDLPNSVKDTDAQIEYLIRPHGIMKRAVTLTCGWHKNAAYPMLAKLKDGTLTALIPGKYSGYFYTNTENGRLIKVTKAAEDLFETGAYCFYKPYPLKKMTEKELSKSVFGAIGRSDIYLLVLISILTVAVSLIVPSVYKILFSYIANGQRIQPLFFAAFVLICVAVAVNLITVVKKLLIGKIKNKLEISCGSAVMMRILSLPTDFFRKYGAGELSSKVQSVSELCEAFSDTVISSGITIVLTVLYFAWIAIFVPQLIVQTVITTLSAVVFSLLTMPVQSEIKQKEDLLASDEHGISYSLISGISKIKLVGGEIRAFAKWGKKYAEKARLVYNPPFMVKLKKSVYVLITVFGSAWIYYTAAASSVTAADFYAFTVCYGGIIGAVSAFFETCDKIADINPKIKNISTFFEKEPEISSDKQTVTHLSGGIELNNITFRYTENKTIFCNLSLKIRPGEYVAVVGKTGCGKSTLIRLLLGFETPQKGGVFYDGKDLSKLDLKSLRQKIGIVMQNGKLFSGDIFSNIAISSPHLTLDEAWDAAEKAGIAEDIRNMPMGMNTVLSEGGGGISGGQKQRILIARAIAANPRIIIFDEATSALDNITQKTVSKTLDNIKCTKIIVAHRLSTIKNCSRIIVLDDGKIAEDGTYEELTQKNGLFAELVSRQKIE